MRGKTKKQESPYTKGAGAARASCLLSDLARLYYTAGCCRQTMGDNEAALENFLKALAFASKDCPDLQRQKITLHLADAYLALNRFGKAADTAAAAIRGRDPSSEVYLRHGYAMMKIQRPLQANYSLMEAYRRNPGDGRAVDYLGVTMHQQGAPTADPQIAALLIRIFREKETFFQRFSGAWHSQLSGTRFWPEIKKMLGIPDVAAIIRTLDSDPESLDALKTDLFTAGISRLLVSNRAYERLLQAARSVCLRRAMQKDRGNHTEKDISLAAALARNAFLSEYVYDISEEERALLDRMETGVSEPDAFCLALYAAYRPLYGSPYMDYAKRKTAFFPESVRTLVKMQILQIEDERRRADRIPALSPIEDEISQKVQAQYEAHPYPRWESGAPLYMFSNAPLGKAFRKTEDVLIAGCGTGKHVLVTKSMYAFPRIDAVDLCRTSLSYASRKLEELGIEDVNLMQADILDLEKLGKQYDIIESVGVLHHMRDPLEGWRVLCRLLKPGGRMHIGLYSAYAREDIVYAKNLIAEQGYSSSPDDMRAARRFLIERAPGDPLLSRLVTRPDFYTLSSCRDMLFHEQEHRITLLQLEDMLNELGLAFTGFSSPLPQARIAYAKRFPEDAGATNLKNWHALEAETRNMFGSMYQFRCGLRS